MHLAVWSAHVSLDAFDHCPIEWWAKESNVLCFSMLWKNFFEKNQRLWSERCTHCRIAFLKYLIYYCAFYVNSSASCIDRSSCNSRLQNSSFFWGVEKSSGFKIKRNDIKDMCYVALKKRYVLCQAIIWTGISSFCCSISSTCYRSTTKFAENAERLSEGGWRGLCLFVYVIWFY